MWLVLWDRENLICFGETDFQNFSSAQAAVLVVAQVKPEYLRGLLAWFLVSQHGKQKCSS